MPTVGLEPTTTSLKGMRSNPSELRWHKKELTLYYYRKNVLQNFLPHDFKPKPSLTKSYIQVPDRKVFRPLVVCLIPNDHVGWEGGSQKPIDNYLPHC